jgi:hypothetical protein
MKHSHKPSLTASRSVRTPTGAQQNAEDAAASSPRTSEGPVPAWAPEAAAPSDPLPAAHTSQEPPGSPPSPRSVPPLRWADPAHARAWLSQVSLVVDDLAAAARDGSRRAKHRVLSRAERRRQARTAELKLAALLEAAAAGLDEGE